MPRTVTIHAPGKIDIHDSAQTAESSKKSVEGAPITARNKELILDFLRDCELGKTVKNKAKKRIGAHRITKYALQLKRLALWLGKDFASGSKDSRPQLDVMMQRLRAKEFDVLMVLRLDRLGRSLQHLLQLIQEFRNLNVRFVSVTQGFDTETPQGRFFLQVIGAVAEFERELIRERINDKLKVLKAQGKKLGRSKGSKDKKERKKGGYYMRYIQKSSSSNMATH